MIDIYIAAAAILIASGASALAGHAAGWHRRGDLEHRRRMAAVVGPPRYVRGTRTPEPHHHTPEGA